MNTYSSDDGYFRTGPHLQLGTFRESGVGEREQRSRLAETIVDWDDNMEEHPENDALDNFSPLSADHKLLLGSSHKFICSPRL